MVGCSDEASSTTSLSLWSSRDLVHIPRAHGRPDYASQRRHQTIKPSVRPALFEVTVRTSNHASQKRHQTAKPSDQPALHEVTVRTSQRPNPRRFRSVHAPGASPYWPFPFSRLVRQAGNTDAEFCTAPASGPSANRQCKSKSVQYVRLSNKW